ncbi:unnamed protein product, partial [Phaeothamnion confervicola]
AKDTFYPAAKLDVSRHRIRQSMAFSPARRCGSALNDCAAALFAGLLTFVLLVGAFAEDATYTEELSLHPLPSGHVVAHFSFEWLWKPQRRHRCLPHEAGIRSNRRLCHFGAFPEPIATIVDQYGVRAASLRFAKGHWDEDAWGPVLDGGGPDGADVWATLPRDGARQRWAGLMQALSGLYCGSLGILDDDRIYEPRLPPFGVPAGGAAANDFDTWTLPGGGGSGEAIGSGIAAATALVSLHGSLPREAVCTENLMPLLRLLPCRSHAGLAELLHPTRLFAGPYYAFGTAVRASWSGDGGFGVGGGDGPVLRALALHHTVTAVIPWASLGNGSGSSGAGGYASSLRRWSLQRLFQPPAYLMRGVRAKPAGEGSSKDPPGADVAPLRACPLAAETRVLTFAPRGTDGGGFPLPPSSAINCGTFAAAGACGAFAPPGAVMFIHHVTAGRPLPIGAPWQPWIAAENGD